MCFSLNCQRISSGIQRVSVEFQRNEPSTSPPDTAEKISNVLLKPWRAINGKCITISNGPPRLYVESKTHHVIAKIFYAALALIIAPIILLGMGVAAFSHSHKLTYRDYLSSLSGSPVTQDLLSRYAAWIRAQVPFPISEGFINEQLSEIAHSGRVDETHLFSADNIRILSERFRQLQEISSYRSSPQEFIQEKLKTVYKTENPKEASDAILPSLQELAKEVNVTQPPITLQAKENISSLLHRKNQLTEVVNIHELRDLENRLRTEVGEILTLRILSNWQWIGEDIRNNEAVLSQSRKEGIIAKAIELRNTNSAQLAEVLSKVEADLRTDLPPMEAPVLQRYPVLPTLLRELPQSQTLIFHRMLCTALINRQINDPLAFVGPKDERTILENLQFDVEAYDNREKTHQIVAVLLQDILKPEHNLSSVNALREQINDIASSERLKAAGVLENQIRNFHVLLDEYMAQRARLRAPAQEITAEFTQHLLLPQAKNKLTNWLLQSIDDHIDQILEQFLVDNRFKVHCFLSSPFSNLGEMIIDPQEHIAGIKALANTLWLKRLEWLQRYQAQFIEEFIQGDGDKNEILGRGVCLALTYRLASTMLDSPNTPIENLRIGSILPSDRFLQASALLNWELDPTKRTKIQYLAKKRIKERISHIPRPENMVAAIVDRLVNPHTPNKILRLTRSHHATLIRFDTHAHRFCFFDPNFGIIHFTRDHEETDQHLAKRMTDCWFDLYKTVYDKEDAHPLWVAEIEKMGPHEHV